MSFIFDAINWKLKIMKKWLCKICFLWENKNRTVVIFLLVGLFVSLGFVYVLLVRNKRLNKENRLLQRQYEAVDNALFRMEEMQKTYLQYENMKKIDDIDLKTETDSILKLSSLLDDKKKIVVPSDFYVGSNYTDRITTTNMYSRGFLSRATKQEDDVNYYIEAIISTSYEDLNSEYNNVDSYKGVLNPIKDVNGLIRKKYDILVNYFKGEYGIDLQKIGDSVI